MRAPPIGKAAKEERHGRDISLGAECVAAGVIATKREQWRMGKQRHPRAVVDLADGIETLPVRG
ncbi:hypothetical protein MAE02_14470 [Microvirga aerophila]|uniref:Uncharacterized protein n=1 Tax=Microvirga aerophila TaxID=670291 RepID=A0A512BP70_9HYPH|nr:hypothetical protein MAE02_14470 [Microvirga aerophila]